MKQGYLSDYFEGVAAKRLSAVEVDPRRSNQHEFNGVQCLREIFGEKRKDGLETEFIYLDDKEDIPLSEKGHVTWYDARKNHPTRTEYRLYFSSPKIMEKATAGDLLIVAKRKDDKVLVVIAPQGSTSENQLIWLFGLSDVSARFATHVIEGHNDRSLDFVCKLILESIDVEVKISDEKLLEKIKKKFGERFPPTKEFSAFARQLCQDINALREPDRALMAWLDTEETLFRTLEKHLVEKRLAEGFEDVDDFIRYSLSVLNRRKSRVGHALENHLEEIFRANRLKYTRGAITENRSRPDFLFPGIASYRDKHFPQTRLNMLGVKSTCKDRWRQVLSEASRIRKKHLFTLEAGISVNQTQEMKDKNLQLVIPQTILETYTPEQRGWLQILKEFIEFIKFQQEGL